MKLATLNASQDNIATVNNFAGLNKNPFGNDNEFSAMKNMTNDQQPILSTRSKRGILQKIENIQGAVGGRKLSYVSGNDLYYDETKVATLDQTDEERQLVIMGAYLCVFPDGVIYNTNDGTLSNMKNKTQADAAVFTLCRYDGTKYTSANTYTGDTEPSDTTLYWIDTSQSPVVMKLYSTSMGMWTSISNTYVKIEATGIGVGFSAYDSATLSGVSQMGFNKYDFNQNTLIYDCGDDYLIITGLIDITFTNEGTMTVERKVPDMDYTTELDNRIWGCSSDNHEIYACKQGDPKNWYCYAGLDSDSYAVTVGTEDDFTGCCAYSGTVYFFKEGGFHKLYGTKPSNYEMNWKPGRGVQRGSSKSIRVIGEYLMYKSRDCICMYDGSITNISQKLGSQNYYEAIAGVYRDKYYVNMRHDEVYTLYVYDITKRTWTQEEDLQVKFMPFTQNGLYLITDDNVLMVSEEGIYQKWYPQIDVYPEEDIYPGETLIGTSESRFEWSFTTHNIGMDSPYRKYVKRINLRFELGLKGRMKIEISYDDDKFETIMNFTPHKLKAEEITIPVRRCDHIKVRISGAGEFKLYSLTKVTEGGTGDD